MVDKLRKIPDDFKELQFETPKRQNDYVRNYFLKNQDKKDRNKRYAILLHGRNEFLKNIKNEDKYKNEGLWYILGKNSKNELIIVRRSYSCHEPWALEWYSKEKDGFGWFQLGNKNSDEYKIYSYYDYKNKFLKSKSAKHIEMKEAKEAKDAKDKLVFVKPKHKPKPIKKKRKRIEFEENTNDPYLSKKIIIPQGIDTNSSEYSCVKLYNEESWYDQAIIDTWISNENLDCTNLDSYIRWFYKSADEILEEKNKIIKNRTSSISKEGIIRPQYPLDLEEAVKIIGSITGDLERFYGKKIY